MPLNSIYRRIWVNLTVPGADYPLELDRPGGLIWEAIACIMCRIRVPQSAILGLHYTLAQSGTPIADDWLSLPR